MRLIYSMLIWLTLTVAAALAQDQSSKHVTGFAHCAADHPLAVGNVDAALAKGFNLPNWDPRNLGYKPDNVLLSHLRAEGFSHIRLPVDGEMLMARFTDPLTITSYLEAMDREVNRLAGLGYAVIVDMHPGGSFQSLHEREPDKGFSALTEAWDRIVERANNWPDNVIYFELLNEPTPDPVTWWSQAQSLVSLLNAKAKGRRLIIGPAVYQRYEPLLAAEPLVGEGLIYAIHYYDPFYFTHQAMTWDDRSFLRDVGQLPFPGDASHPALKAAVDKLKRSGKREAAKSLEETYRTRWDAARIASDFDPVGKWATKHNTAVIISEFGVLDFDVDKFARADWIRAVREGAERHCMGWTHWDFSDGFAMVDPTTSLPIPSIMDALLSVEASQ